MIDMNMGEYFDLDNNTRRELKNEEEKIPKIA